MLQIVRQTSFQYFLEQPLSRRRGFLFQLAAGFHKEVDPLSGMTVNLVDLDTWLKQCLLRLPQIPAQQPSDLLQFFRTELSALAVTVQAQLVWLQLKESEGAAWSWEACHDKSYWERKSELYELSAWSPPQICRLSFFRKIEASTQVVGFPSTEKLVSEFLKAESLQAGVQALRKNMLGHQGPLGLCKMQVEVLGENCVFNIE